MQFGGGKTGKQAQRATMANQSASDLDVKWTWPGVKPRTARIRVFADEAYRSQNVGWQDGFEEQLEVANAVLRAKFGLELEGEYRAWERNAPDTQLSEDLEALMALDDGDDVFVVIGLTSALRLATPTFDKLGVATRGGRHIVIRGFSDLEERKGFERAFPDLDSDERDLALAGLRVHKTATVILHELGHSLGYGHETEADTLMSASYSRRAGAYSATARTKLAEAIEARLPNETSEGKSVVTLYLSEDGDIIHDGKVILDSDLDNFLIVHRDTELVINQQRAAPAKLLDGLRERAKKHGLTKVSVTTF
jgi:hypothetical protein